MRAKARLEEEKTSIRWKSKIRLYEKLQQNEARSEALCDNIPWVVSQGLKKLTVTVDSDNQGMQAIARPEAARSRSISKRETDKTDKIQQAN